ncbi:MAG: hypothetical protein WD646_05875 [Actinomycetota bacterium]
MADFPPPSMPDARSEDPAPGRPGAPIPASPPQRYPSASSGPGPLARVLALIVSVGLAWAIALALTAWLLGLFLARG